MKSLTKLYTPIVSGVPVNMISMTGKSQEEAARLCKSIFGKRFEGFTPMLSNDKRI